MRAEISINNDVSKQCIYVGKGIHHPLDMKKLRFSHISRTIHSK